MLELILVFAVTASVDVDAHQIKIESNDAVHSIYEDRYEWTGNVIVTEDIYTLNAASLVVFLNDMDEPCRITAAGEPVKAYGPHKGENATVTGEVVLYDCEQNKVRVSGKAHVSVPSDSTSLSADNIIYDLIKKRILATGDKKPERVQLRLDP